jgi:hypothetical protein
MHVILKTYDHARVARMEIGPRRGHALGLKSRAPGLRRGCADGGGYAGAGGAGAVVGAEEAASGGRHDRAEPRQGRATPRVSHVGGRPLQGKPRPGLPRQGCESI